MREEVEDEGRETKEEEGIREEVEDGREGRQRREEE